MEHRLVQKIRKLLQLDWEVKVCHCYREAVNVLANIGCDSGSSVIYYELVPVQISHLLVATC